MSSLGRTQMQFMMISNQPEVSRYVCERGVGRIFVDMEVLGKHERQANANTPIYSHRFEDITAIKKAIGDMGEVMVRINPVHAGTQDEVERAIGAGTDVIMLPFSKSPSEVEAFLGFVRGRVTTNILFESGPAIARARMILDVPGIDEVHYGLNDIRIALGADFLFESVAGGLLDWLCGEARTRGLSYGVGGIGRVGKELLPAEQVMREYVRLGSERVILSRVFHGEKPTVDELEAYVDFAAEVEALRKVEAQARRRTESGTDEDRRQFAVAVQKATDHVLSLRAQKEGRL